MFTIITILIFIVCILMILTVLVQKSKGGGLATNFSSANQVMGVRKTTDFLEKATWTLAAAMVVLSVVSSAFVVKTSTEEAPIQITTPANQPTDAGNIPSFPATGTNNQAK